MKTAVVTGGSSGIGQSIALLLAKQGYRVFELSRHEKPQNGIEHIDCDISDPEQVEHAFRRLAQKCDHLDLLVNNAGYGISGAVELTRESDAERLMQVNFLGAFYASKRALPLLRKSPCARIVNISSVAGIISIPFQAFYSASKYALNALTLAMANELRPFGIKVCAVMPGDVHTGFTAARQKSTDESHIYSGKIEKSVSQMEKDETQGMPPEKVAASVVRLCMKRRPAALTVVGAKYKLFSVLAKLLPSSLTNYLVGKLY